MKNVSLCWSTKDEYKIWLPFREQPAIFGVCLHVYIYVYFCTYFRIYVFNIAEICLYIGVGCKKIAGAQLRAIQSLPCALE
jgi:hypothetical protein